VRGNVAFRFVRVVAVLAPWGSIEAQANPAVWPVRVDGGVMSGVADQTMAADMAAARLRVEWPVAMAAIDVASPLAPVRDLRPAALGVGGALRGALIHGGPDAIQVNGLVAARYATRGGRGGAAMRVDMGDATGLWVGARVGDIRVDSIGVSYEEQEPPIGLSVASVAPGGSAGLGGGVWHRDGGLAFGASVTTGWTRYFTTFVSSQPGAPGADSIARSVADTTAVTRYATVALTRLWASWSLGRFSWDVAGGTRASAHLPTVGWASGTVAVRLISPVAFVVSAGNRGTPMYGPLVDRGTRGYAAIGLRLSHWALSHSPISSGSESSSNRLATGYRIVPLASGERMLIVVAPSARQIDVRGDFTSWGEVACTRIAGGGWQVPLPILPGIYRVAIRVDGGVWEPLPGAPLAASEFGDALGVIIVP